MPLHLDYDLTTLKPAAYNPRHISDADLDNLKASIQTLGLVKPLIARSGVYVAGHQRARALQSLGITRAPVYLLPVKATLYDEIRFNQLHNGTDLDAGDENCFISKNDPNLSTFQHEAIGYTQVAAERITGNFRGKLAGVRSSLCDMILKFGPFGGVVATHSGKVIHAAQYALACALTRTPLTVFVIADADEAKYRAYLGKQYGVFSYKHLQRDTYIQTLAQMNRLRDTDSGRQNKTALYEGMVMPYLAEYPGFRALDFGSGHGDYAAKMRNKFYDVRDVELFRRNAAQAIDLGAVNFMVDRMLADLKRHGPYNVTICDSVLNSVDCLEAESALMSMLNALTCSQGRLFFSGRRLETIEEITHHTKNADFDRRYVTFLDEDGFSAYYRQGHWYYQKYHSRDGAVKLAEQFGFRVIAESHSRTSFQMTAVKDRDLPLDQVLAACDYEFNLPINDTRRLGRHEDVKTVMSAIYAPKMENA